MNEHGDTTNASNNLANNLTDEDATDDAELAADQSSSTRPRDSRPLAPAHGESIDTDMDTHLVAEAALLKTQATEVYEQSFQLQRQASTLNAHARLLDQQASDLLLLAEIQVPQQQTPPNQGTAERFLQNLFRDVLSIVTDGRMRLCNTADDLPPPLEPACEAIVLTQAGGLGELRRCAKEASLRIGVSAERWQDFITASHEAGMNAAVHAGGGIGRVNSDGQETVQVWIEDHGHGINVERLPRATLERGYSTAGTLGYGMKLMLQGIDRVWLLTRPSGTTIVLEQDRIEPEPAWF